LGNVVSQTAGNSGEQQQAEHTPSAHGLTLGRGNPASSAYRRGEKERVNSLGNVTNLLV
jgi:hypothetical protein